MKKYIVFGMVLSLFISPIFVSALSIAPPDDTDSDSSVCISLQYNLKYKMKDANTNGEVSVLQDFLEVEGYLNSEPTGYFDLATRKAVRAFQKANKLRVNGFVNSITRAKIKAISCDDIDPTTPITKTSNSMLDLKVNGSDGPVNVPYGSTVMLSWQVKGDVWGCYLQTGELGMTGSIDLNSGRYITNKIEKYGRLSIGLSCNNNLVEDLVIINIESRPEACPPGALYSIENGKPCIYPTPTIPTVTLTPSQTSVTAGQSVALTWTSINATNGCNASNIPGGSAFSTASGSISIAPTQTKTYSVTCYGGYGPLNSALATTASVTVHVNPVTASNTCTIKSFTATPNPVIDTAVVKPMVILAWETNNCDIVHMTGGFYDGVAPAGVIAKSGVLILNISQTATYTLNASTTYKPYGDNSVDQRDLTVTVNPVVPTSTSLGDVNLDGVVNVIDAQQVSRYVSNLTTFTDQQKKNADVNGNGVITTADSDLISKYSVGLITSFPALTSTLLGDANLDIAINVIDAQQIARFIAGLTVFSGQQLKNADVNRDGVVNATDSDLISQYSVGSITTFPTGTVLGAFNVVNKFKIGDNVKVKITGNLNVRADAGVSSQSLGAQQSGALGTVIDGPRTADGKTWWEVDYTTQQDGWSVEDYLIAN